MTVPTLPSRDGRDKRAIWAWCFYDWANSAFPTVIITFVFAAYFTKSVAANPEMGTALWGQAMAITGLIVALSSPVMGAIADQAGRRKPWVAAFTMLCVGATAMLWFVEPDQSWQLYALVLVVIAALGAEIASVFYNAMLTGLVQRERYGRLSGWGWGLGYAGGLMCLLAALALVKLEPPLFGLDAGTAEPVRASAPLVAAWYGLFALPLFFFTPDSPRTALSLGQSVRKGLAALWGTARNLKKHANVAKFLLARMIYTDGLNTLFAFGGIYAAGTFGMDFGQIILFGIAVNVTAGLGAAAFGWIDDWIGPKPTIAIALLGLSGLGGGLLFVESQTMFWVLGLPLGIFIGPAQSASRSMMARLAPPELTNEMFGLFALSGKLIAFMGPAALGWATLEFGSQRAGMATILVFLLGGLVLLLATVKAPGRE